MSYPGYSETEYISHVASILSDRYGLPFERARRLVSDDPEMRYYRSGTTRSPAPSAFANRVAKTHRLKAVEKKGPPMEPGYAYKYIGRGEWEDVIVFIDNAKFEGFATIYGNRMAVWKSGRHSYAQTAVGQRHESHWTGADKESHGNVRGKRRSRRSRRSRR
jgi:hypothetical protein